MKLACKNDSFCFHVKIQQMKANAFLCSKLDLASFFAIEADKKWIPCEFPQRKHTPTSPSGQQTVLDAIFLLFSYSFTIYKILEAIFHIDVAVMLTLLTWVTKGVCHTIADPE